MLRSALLLAIVSLTQANALAIFSNDITNPAPQDFNPFTAGQVVDPNLLVTGIGRGRGINANAAQNRYNARDWSLAGVDASDYFTWTLDPSDGYALNIDTLNYTGQRSGTGPVSAALRSSLDNFTADLHLASFPTASVGNPISVILDTSFQNLTDTIEFRLFAYGGSAVAGTFSVNDFQFGGSLVLVDVTPVESGDFNGDGFIDAADYTIWRDNENQTGVGLAGGDGNNDGTVDALDYAIWSQQYAPAVSEGAAAIPEPGSLVMAIACLLAGAKMQWARD